MTTKVTLETTEHPVRVTTRERLGKVFHPTGDKTVQPNSSETFHITSSTTFAFEELPVERQATAGPIVEAPTETRGRREIRTEERVKAEERADAPNAGTAARR